MDYGAVDIILIILAVLILCFFAGLTIYYMIDRKKTAKQLNELATSENTKTTIEQQEESDLKLPFDTEENN